MDNIEIGVQELKSTSERANKDNAQNRVARSLGWIAKFIDEFEGLKDKSRTQGANNAPKFKLLINNSFGMGTQPAKFELELVSTTKIGELKDIIGSKLTPNKTLDEL